MKSKKIRLPNSELDIMLALWDGHPDMTTAEIQAYVNQKKNLSPTTFPSLFSRLEKKGCISVKKDGKKNLYTPLISKEEYQQNESAVVLDKLYGNSIRDFVASLYHGKGIPKEDLKELEEYIKELDDEEK